MAKPEEDENKGLKPLIFFLNSQLNVELVYVILHGISLINLYSEVFISAFGDVTVHEELKKLKILENSDDAELFIDHYVVYNMNDLDLSFTNVENEPGSNSNDIDEENLEVGGRRVASSVKILFH